MTGRATPGSGHGLRLLFATPRFHPESGGVETHVREVSRRLAAMGVAVTVVTTDPGGLARSEDVDGVRVLRAPAWPRGTDARYARDLRALLSGGTWDLVHVQSYHTLMAPQAMAWARRHRLPFVLTFHAGGHSSRLRNMLRPGQQLALRPLLAHADALVVLTPEEIERYGRLLRLPADRFALVPNGADLPAPPDDASRGTEAGLIVSVGRLERYKGHQHAIRALPVIRQQRPDARLWIAGAGRYEAELRRLARGLGVEDRVEIRAIPPHERERMARELARANLVVLLSEFETHPIAALEAIALRRRLVVADAPGLRELAAQGLADAVATDAGPQAVARAMLRRMNGPEPPAPPALPSWDDCAAGLHALYLRIVS
ncbi:MAG TPA: glycosyltransferase family 4 protein [Miltoncostaeaceae bacterium]|nr:glycosyltransferase family 4 protein [Miltoncostaeaceae bacterium]